MIGWPVKRDPTYGCLLWTGRLDKHGYPRTDDNRLAYRAVYESEIAPIPDGLELDHLCRDRRCVFHLEPVTRSQNELRKSWSFRCRIKMCPRGHALTPYTAMTTPHGGRVCRTCRDQK